MPTGKFDLKWSITFLNALCTKTCVKHSTPWTKIQPKIFNVIFVVLLLKAGSKITIFYHFSFVPKYDFFYYSKTTTNME